MNRMVVRDVATPQPEELRTVVVYLNNPKRLLLYKGTIIDWRHCEAARCGNNGMIGCHSCFNWQESETTRMR